MQEVVVGAIIGAIAGVVAGVVIVPIVALQKLGPAGRERVAVGCVTLMAAIVVIVVGGLFWLVVPALFSSRAKVQPAPPANPPVRPPVVVDRPLLPPTRPEPAFYTARARVEHDAAKGCRILKIGNTALAAAALTSDGKTLVAFKNEGELSTWDVGTGEGKTASQNYSSFGLALTPDGLTVAVTARDVLLLDRQTLLRRAALDSPHRLGVDYFQTLAVAPNGQFAAAGYHEGGVQIWTLADRAQAPPTPGHKAAVISAAFGPDSTLLATGDLGHTISSGKCLAAVKWPPSRPRAASLRDKASAAWPLHETASTSPRPASTMSWSSGTWSACANGPGWPTNAWMTQAPWPILRTARFSPAAEIAASFICGMPLPGSGCPGSRGAPTYTTSKR